MYISIKSIFPQLPLTGDDIDDSYILEQAYSAAYSLGLHHVPDRKLGIYQVNNHRCPLPEDLYKLELITYQLEKAALSQEDLVALCQNLTEEQQAECGCNDATLSHILNYDQYTRIQNQGISNFYNLFVNTDYHRNNFGVLRERNSPFMQALHCGDDPGLVLNQCDESYSITTNRDIVTSFKKGTICISYLAYPLDECGDLLIPDNADYQRAIINFVMMKHWELKMNMREEGARMLWETYKRDWTALAQRVRANMMIKRISPDNINYFQNRYRRIAMNDSVWRHIKGITISDG